MDHKTAEMILTFFLSLTSLLTHSLQYFYTAVRVNYPEFTAVGLVDGEQIVYYDSNIRTLIPKTEWMKKVDTDDPHYWIRETQRMLGEEEDVKVLLSTMERFNQTKGVHTLQQMYGCEFNDDDTISGYEQYGYDGEDFLSLDLKTETWTAVNKHAEVLKDKGRWGNGYKRDQKFYLENECIDWLKKFVSYGRERKARPEVSMFYKHFPRPELVCHATGFFPSGLVMFWQKDGEELHEDVEITATVPNQDGTFQKRDILRVSPEELKEHEYTCVVQHSSLEKDLVLKAPGRRTTFCSGSGSVDVGGGSLGIIVLAGVAFLALVALIAGVLIWKKSSSGFKPVSEKKHHLVSKPLMQRCSVTLETGLLLKIACSVTLVAEPGEKVTMRCQHNLYRSGFIFWFKNTSADADDQDHEGPTHCEYLYTAVRGVNLTNFTAVGLVDGEQILYYDSNIRKMIPKTEWMKKIDADDADYWIRETQHMQGDEEDFKVHLFTIMERFNHTEGVHTLQNMYGCEFDDDGTISGYDRYGYDGENFLDLDLKTFTWTAANKHAEALKDKGRWGHGYKRDQKFYLEKECISWLKKYVSYGRETLERKVCPEASVFHKHFPQPELVCHTTGFFPKEINITWLKDGEDNVSSNDTLPNQDGTLQKRAVLRVSPEELKEPHLCGSAQQPGEGLNVGGGSLGIIVGAVVAVLALVALVALVALIAKVLIWKKKNSGAERNIRCSLKWNKRNLRLMIGARGGTHSLQHIYTTVKGVNLPEFTVVVLMDGEQILYYDSNIRTLIPKTEWMKKVDADDPNYWIRETQRIQGDEEDFKVHQATIMERFNHMEGVHVVQRMYGCELDDDGTTRGYYQDGYDGEDFISLDLKTETWTPANPQAVITRHKWEATGEAKYQKHYLENICIDWLKKFVSYGRETLERKDHPEASVFHKNFPRPELVCHATGFFPSGLVMSWQKDGEELHEDVEIRETLPNQDGTFQKRAVLGVSPEELKEHEYTCVVQHSSLEKDLVLKAPDPGGGSLGIIGAVVAAVLALIAGVLIWKNCGFILFLSGFKPVPAKLNNSCETVSKDPDSTSIISSTSSNVSNTSSMKKLNPTTGTRR
ncbi:uncharacterized protein LOC134335753 [Trichomycterus rosablanca]|uniref:uncharacterized protein LOC134335753 n=1 Tax=Trichomycterus rosablanca TaxID=2290929 RepID=UPI002F36050E